MSAKRKSGKGKFTVPVNLLIASLGLIGLMITVLSTMGVDAYFKLCTDATGSVLGRFAKNTDIIYLLTACFGVVFYTGLSSEFRSRLSQSKWLRKLLPFSKAAVVVTGLGFLFAVVRYALLASLAFVKFGSGQDIQTALMVFSILVWVYFIILLVLVLLNEIFRKSR